MSLAEEVCGNSEHHPGLPGPFRAWIAPDGRVVLEGELDLSGLEALRAGLDQAMLDTTEAIVVDAANLSFVDSAGISELIRYQLAASTQQRRLYLEPVSKPVAKLLDLLDLCPVLMRSTDR